MASCLQEVQIDRRTLLLNRCLVLLWFFWLDFVYSFLAKISFTLEALKLKAQVALLLMGRRIKKINVCVYTRNSSPGSAEFAQKAFNVEFALQGACGAGGLEVQLPLPSMRTRSSKQIFPYIQSTM